ncbi:MAG TPA: energy-coupling factor ABC transporter permease [Chloroflexaceae bacterium]|nr:energy-coupling factor ABC transporter permease [Chloroflexaceae bacterium]
MGPWARGAVIAAGALALVIVEARPAHAMQIMEGFLPPLWCLAWFAVAAPFWLAGLRRAGRLVAERPEARPLLGLAAAFAFVLGTMTIPGAAGASAHPTGAGLGAVLFGPAVMALLGTVVLLFQALLLAHGGLTTLGANAVSAAIAGPIVAWAVWHGLRGRAPAGLAVCLAAAAANLASGAVTALQLALAYPDPAGGVGAAFARFAALFALAQVPLAIGEGLLTALIFRALRAGAAPELEGLGALKGAGAP